MPGFCEGITFGRKCISVRKSFLVVPGENDVLEADPNRVRIIAVPPDKEDLPATIMFMDKKGGGTAAGQAIKLAELLIFRIEDWGPVITEPWIITLTGTQGNILIYEILSTYCPVE